MPTRVQAPDGTLIDFPDSMKEPDIEAALGKLYPKSAAPAPPSLSDKIQGGAKDIASGFLQGVNPFHGLGDTIKAVASDPTGALGSMAANVLAHPYMAAARAYDSLKAGKPEEAMAHLQSAMDPAGFQTEEAMVKTATPGQRLEGGGQLVGNLAQALLMAKGIEKAPVVAEKAQQVVADHPKLVQGTGAAAGAAIGHATGVPGAGFAGAYVGREVGKSLAESAKDAVQAKSVPSAPPPIPEAAPAASPPPLPAEAPPVAAPAEPAIDTSQIKLGGVPFDKLPPQAQQNVLAAIKANPNLMPKATANVSESPAMVSRGTLPTATNGLPLKPPEVPSATVEPPGAAAQEVSALLKEIPKKTAAQELADKFVQRQIRPTAEAVEPSYDEGSGAMVADSPMTKSYHLATQLHEMGVTADQAEDLSPTSREELAQRAVKDKSAKTSNVTPLDWRRAMTKLRRLEAQSKELTAK